MEPKDPPAQDSLLQQYSDQDVLLQITNPDRGKGAILKKIGITILSLVIFAGIGLFRSTWNELVILIAVLFVHEAGHLMAMKLFKYSDVKMLFLPLMGAVMTGREQTPHSARRALVSIAGPMPGLLIGLFFAILYAAMHEKLYYDIAAMFIFLNAFNLLPLYPLDGGSFFESILFSRNYAIEVIFKVITSLLLIAVAILLQAWMLILLPLFILLTLKSSHYVHKAAKALKAELAQENIETPKLTEELVGRIRRRLDAKAFAGKATLKNLASSVEATWQRIFIIPPRFLKTLSLLVLYFVCLIFIVAGIVGLSGWEDKGLTHLNKGEYDLAISEFDKKLETNPMDADTYVNRGLAYGSKGQYDRAITDFNKALEINPKSAMAYNNRGWAYLAIDQLDQAMPDLNRALEINPKFDLPHYNLGMVYVKRTQYDKAIVEYTKTLEINARHAPSYKSRGLLYRQKGLYDQAISDFNKTLEIIPEDPWVYYNRGVAYGGRDQYDQAISDFNKVLEINPRNASAYNNLAWIFATAKESKFHNGTKAVEHALKACELSGWKTPSYLDTLAAAYARTGDFENALKWEEKAIESVGQPEKSEAEQRRNLYRRGRAWPAE